jgi:predicted DCC family thiol-disulfide oxidoreductase YuxK
MIKNKYIIFDGECGFCNKTILFLAKKDTKDKYLFVSNLSQKGIELLQKFDIKNLSNSTIILIDNDKYYIKTLAILNFFIDINFFKIFFTLLKILPLSFTNRIYDLISRNRKKIIRNTNCEIPKLNISRKIINS